MPYHHQSPNPKIWDTPPPRVIPSFPLSLPPPLPEPSSPPSNGLLTLPPAYRLQTILMPVAEACDSNFIIVGLFLTLPKVYRTKTTGQ